MPTLVELDAYLMSAKLRPDGVRYVPARSLAKAQGMRFLCPLCWVANKGRIGTHSVLVGFARRAPPGLFSCDSGGKDSRWIVTGTSIEDLTLRPSIWLKGEGCGWHGYVTKGCAA